MPHFIITYNFDNVQNRKDFIKSFEDLLVKYGLEKEKRNQSTYYGTYESKEALSSKLLNDTNHLKWQQDDIVTIFYPNITATPDMSQGDIGRHFFKEAGSLSRRKIISGSNRLIEEVTIKDAIKKGLSKMQADKHFTSDEVTKLQNRILKLLRKK